MGIAYVIFFSRRGPGLKRQTLEAVRWRRRSPRGRWVETASSWREISILSFRRSFVLFCFRRQWSNFTFFVDLTSIMAPFREVRDLLAVACFEDIIDEYEFLLLWDLYTSKNLDFRKYYKVIETNRKNKIAFCTNKYLQSKVLKSTRRKHGSEQCESQETHPFLLLFSPSLAIFLLHSHLKCEACFSL